MLCNCNFVFMAVIDNSINLFTNGGEGITMTKINKSICSVLKITETLRLYCFYCLYYAGKDQAH